MIDDTSKDVSDLKNLNFDSFIVPTAQLKLNGFRLLEVANRCVLPLNYNIRILAASM